VRAGIALLLGALAVASRASSQDPAQDSTTGAEAGEASAPADRDRTPDHPALVEALDRLARDFPERVVVGSIGAGRSGRPIPLVTFNDPAGGPPQDKPAMLLCAGLWPGDSASSESALQALFDLAGRSRAEGALADVVLYAIPLADPDGGAAGATGEVEIDRNFPIGWDPWRFGPAAGPYPGSHPVTRALTDFLLAHPEISVVQLLVTPPPGSASDVTICDPDDPGCSHDREEPQPFLVYADGVGRGGSLLEFAHRQLGAHGYSIPIAPPGSGSEPGGPRRHGERILELTGELSAALPRVQLGEVELARLRNDLWQLDVPVRNAGSLSALCCRGAAGGSARLRLSGGRRLATALRQSGEEVFRVRSDGDDPAPSLGMLEGGQEVTVRLLVEAAEGSSLELEVEAPRSGRDRRTVELR